jgi:hypothetical protein
MANASDAYWRSFLLTCHTLLILSKSAYSIRKHSLPDVNIYRDTNQRFPCRYLTHDFAIGVTTSVPFESTYALKSELS